MLVAMGEQAKAQVVEETQVYQKRTATSRIRVPKESNGFSITVPPGRLYVYGMLVV